MHFFRLVDNDGKPINTDRAAFDNFNRSNSGTMGQAQSGAQWNTVSGPWGIISNQAYCNETIAYDAFTVLPTRCANGTILCTVSRNNSRAGLIFRYQDANNYFRIWSDGASTVMQRILAGVTTQIASDASAPPVTSLWEVSLNGSSIRARLNGALKFGGTVTDGNLLTARSHGLYNVAVNSDNRYEDFIVSERVLF